MIKTIPIEQDYFYLKVSPQDFYKTWEQGYHDSLVIPKAIEYMQPFLQNWYNMLTIPGYPKDLNYITLYKILGPKAERLISRGTAYLVDEGIEDSLRQIALNQFAFFTYYPRTPDYLIYSLSLNFKHQLKALLLFASRQPLDVPLHDLKLHPSYTEKIHKIQLTKLSTWQAYLHSLKEQGVVTPYQLTKYTHLPTTTLQREIS